MGLLSMKQILRYEVFDILTEGYSNSATGDDSGPISFISRFHNLKTCFPDAVV
jgi:hypothetical protein